MSHAELAVSKEPCNPSPDWMNNTRQYLVPPCVERSNGTGPLIDLGARRGKLMVISTVINHVAEQEWLAISIWGSVDGTDWGTKPLFSLPRKCYCGVYSAFLDLTKHPQVRYLRVEWNMLRWAKGENTPLFGFCVSAEESETRTATALVEESCSVA